MQKIRVQQENGWLTNEQAKHCRQQFSLKFEEREHLNSELRIRVSHSFEQMEAICRSITPLIVDERELDLYKDKCRRFLKQLHSSGPVCKDLSATLMLAWRSRTMEDQQPIINFLAQQSRIVEERGFYLGQVCEVIKQKRKIVSQVSAMEAGLAKFE